MTAADTDRAITDAYTCIAESSLLRDAAHARCACDFLHGIPAPRESTEPARGDVDV